MCVNSSDKSQFDIEIRLAVGQNNISMLKVDLMTKSPKNCALVSTSDILLYILVMVQAIKLGIWRNYREGRYVNVNTKNKRQSLLQYYCISQLRLKVS